MSTSKPTQIRPSNAIATHIAECAPEIQLLIIKNTIYVSKCGREKSNILALNKATYQNLAPKYYQSCVFCFQNPGQVIDNFLSKANSICLQNTRIIRVTLSQKPMYQLTSRDEYTIIGNMEKLVDTTNNTPRLAMLSKLEITAEMTLKWVWNTSKPIEEYTFDMQSDDPNPWFDAMQDMANHVPDHLGTSLEGAAPQWKVNYSFLMLCWWDSYPFEDMSMLDDLSEDTRVKAKPWEIQADGKAPTGLSRIVFDKMVMTLTKMRSSPLELGVRKSKFTNHLKGGYGAAVG